MTARAYLWAARVCGAAAVACAGLAAYDYFRPVPGPEPAWVVAPEVAELGDVALGEHIVAFEMTNPAGRPRRIVGLIEYCSGNVCIRSRHRDVITVEAGGTFRYECTVKVGEAGLFDVPIAVFVDDGGIRTVTLGARGTGR